jgi:hypothetical protein
MPTHHNDTHLSSIGLATRRKFPNFRETARQDSVDTRAGYISHPPCLLAGITQPFDSRDEGR